MNDTSYRIIQTVEGKFIISKHCGMYDPFLIFWTKNHRMEWINLTKGGQRCLSNPYFLAPPPGEYETMEEAEIAVLRIRMGNTIVKEFNYNAYGDLQPTHSDLDPDNPPKGSGVPSRIDESLQRETFRKSMGKASTIEIDPMKIKISDSGSVVPVDQEKLTHLEQLVSKKKEYEHRVAFKAGFYRGLHWSQSGHQSNWSEIIDSDFVRWNNIMNDTERKP